MKKLTISIIVTMVFALTISCLNAHGKDMTSIFPDFEGWSKKGKPDIYTPDNLFEYINGAAEVFLSYDFVKLAALTYENNKKNSFTVDVYRHSSNRNGFGIYSQEKPRQGSFLTIGAQGYYEKGVLNFFKGSYYVKMSGYDLGDNDEKVLTTTAQKIANALEGVVHFPAAVKCFPGKGKVANSEAYINKNFLGHSFLHSAYVADYEMKGQKFQVFIIETHKPEEAEEILNKYTAFVKKKGIKVDQVKNFYRFQDPYYRSSGMMNMKMEKNYLWGLFSKDNAAAESLIREIGNNLEKYKLL
ncbi:MAG: hypothetical protein JSV88_30960 [Candidatus Aminicenantes bacterium]|nr:MAG: hypothetical protein JSV88_30960 [Candidatus Aminicenantes bacterium]